MKTFKNTNLSTTVIKTLDRSRNHPESLETETKEAILEEKEVSNQVEDKDIPSDVEEKEVTPEEWYSGQKHKDNTQEPALCHLCFSTTHPSYRVITPSQAFEHPECQHFFCCSCIKSLIQSWSSFRNSCPLCQTRKETATQVAILPDTIAQLNDLFHLFKTSDVRRYRVLSIQPELRSFCPTCGNFQALMSVSTRRVVCEPNLLCPDYCHHCNVEWHENMSCASFQDAQQEAKEEEDENRKNEQDEENASSEVLIAEIAKPCPQCGVMSVHYRGEGCHHITCHHCDYEWCYGCERWYDDCAENPCDLPKTCDARECVVCPKLPSSDGDTSEEDDTS